MHLDIAERQIGAVTVLDLVGKLTIEQDAQRLKDKINSLILPTPTHRPRYICPCHSRRSNAATS